MANTVESITETSAMYLNLIALWEHILNNLKMNHYVSNKQFARNPYLKELVKRLAKGKCQFCNNYAPFNDTNGEPYLEEHHAIYLAEGGEDSLYNVLGICPNCHKLLHIRKDEFDKQKSVEIARRNVELLSEELKKYGVL